MKKNNISSNSLNMSSTGLNELKSRIIVVIFGIAVFRLGSHIPVPGLDPMKLAEIFDRHISGTIFGLMNMFSGGALSRFSIFATGIMPYISASIIMQLFSSAIPALEQLKKEGESGRKQINQYTRYLTLFIGLIQSFGMAKFLAYQGVAYQAGGIFYFTTCITLVTGTIFLMWLGEQITERGVGNGISLIIFAGIVSSFPSSMAMLIEQYREGQLQGITLLTITILLFAMGWFVVFFERAQRRITVNYAQRTQGRKIYASQTSHLPLKLNMAGVIPPIFATAFVLLPATLATWFGSFASMEWLNDITSYLTPGNWFYTLFFSLCIVFFAFVYTSMVFNPKETADNLKKSGAFIPGIRPGFQTADFVDGVQTRLTVVGAIYLVLICGVPDIISTNVGVAFFGGTSLLIVVVVVMDFIAQVQSHLMTHQYDSLMKKSKIGRRA